MITGKRSWAILATLVAALAPSFRTLSARDLFVRGDSDGNGAIEITDAIVTLGELFLGDARISCDDAADTNDDGGVDLADPVYGLNFLYLGGPAPLEPFPRPGADPTPDELTCGPCSGPGCGPIQDVVLATEARLGRIPAIAVDSTRRPLVLFSGDANRVVFGIRTPGEGWTLEDVADESGGETANAMRAGIAIDPVRDLPVALLATSAGVETWRASAEGDEGAMSWSLARRLEGFEAGFRNVIAVDADGVVHGALERVEPSGPRQPGIMRDDGESFDFAPVGEPAWVERMTLALSSGGEPQVAFWQAGESGWEVRHGGRGSAVWTVAPLGSNSLEPHQHIAFALGGEAAPWHSQFLIQSIDSESADSRLTFVEDTDVHPVASDDPFWASPNFCFEAPPVDGSICSVDYTIHVSIGVVIDSEGTPRFVYSRYRIHGELVARCPDFDPQTCEIERSLEVEGDLRVGWIEDGEVRESVLVDDVATKEASVAIDHGDRLHVICNDESAGEARLRYFELANPWVHE